MLAIVTGANSGMGKATAAALADKGYEVIMLCRSSRRGRDAFRALKQEKIERKLHLMICDLGSYTSIKRFVKAFSEKYERLDVLVNNAGFISLDRQFTQEGVERQFGINHLGHFLLTNLLVPYMGEGSRIVVVASGAHKIGKIHFDDINLKKGFNVVEAYSQSKLANVLFTRDMAKRLAAKGITVNCCHPGAVATNIGISRDTGFGKTVTGALKPFFQSPEQGAETAVFLASDASVSDISGEYFYKCQIAKSSKQSKDAELAERLFKLSSQMTGLQYPRVSAMNTGRMVNIQI